MSSSLVPVSAESLPPQGSELGGPVRQAVRSVLRAIGRRAANASVAGPNLTDALQDCHLLAGHGFVGTVGFWNSTAHTPEDVARENLDALVALHQNGLEGGISVKAHALQFRSDLLDDIIGCARDLGRPVHFDAAGWDQADQTHRLVETALALSPRVGVTLPGRWRRSVDDAGWAIELGLSVRVVKGKWPDPTDPQRDDRAGFLDVIDHLAGRASHVRVATHDPALAKTALARLCRAGTSCEMELLVGLPAQTCFRTAREAQVRASGYVAYGEGFTVYSVREALHSAHAFRQLASTLIGPRRRDYW